MLTSRALWLTAARSRPTHCLTRCQSPAACLKAPASRYMCRTQPRRHRPDVAAHCAGKQQQTRGEDEEEEEEEGDGGTCNPNVEEEMKSWRIADTGPEDVAFIRQTVEELESKDPTALLNAAECIKGQIVRSRVLQDAIVDAGAIPKLSAMLKSETPLLRAAAAEALCMLALQHKDVTARLKADGLIEKLPPLLRPESSSNSIFQPSQHQQWKAADQAGPLPAEQHDLWRTKITQLAAELNSPDTSVAALAAMQLCAAAPSLSRSRVLVDHLVATGIVTALLECVKSTDWQVKGFATQLLWRLASVPEVLPSIPAIETVTALHATIKQLGSMSGRQQRELHAYQICADIHVPATGLLVVFSRRYPATVASAGLTPLLVNLLGATSQGNVVRIHAAEALSHLAENSSARQTAIADANVLPHLKAMLKCSDADLSSAAAVVIGSLALHNEEIKDRMRKDGNWRRDDWGTTGTLFWEYRKQYKLYRALVRLLKTWGLVGVPREEDLLFSWQYPGYNNSISPDTTSEAEWQDDVELDDEDLNHADSAQHMDVLVEDNESCSEYDCLVNDVELDDDDDVVDGPHASLADQEAILQQAKWLELDDIWDQIDAAKALLHYAHSESGRDIMVAEGVFDTIMRKYEDVSQVHRAVTQACMAWGMDSVRDMIDDRA